MQLLGVLLHPPLPFWLPAHCLPSCLPADGGGEPAAKRAKAAAAAGGAKKKELDDTGKWLVGDQGMSLLLQSTGLIVHTCLHAWWAARAWSMGFTLRQSQPIDCALHHAGQPIRLVWFVIIILF